MLHISVLKNVIKHSLNYFLNIETEIENIYFIPMNTKETLDRIKIDDLNNVFIKKIIVTTYSYDKAFEKSNGIWKLHNIEGMYNHLTGPADFNYYCIKGTCIIADKETLNKDILTLSNSDKYVFNISFLTTIIDSKEILVKAILDKDDEYIRLIN